MPAPRPGIAAGSVSLSTIRVLAALYRLVFLIESARR